MIAAQPNKYQTNMVDNQIKTFSVNNDKVLEAFSAIQRFQFVPESLQGSAYVGEDLEVGKNRYLLEPAIHARLVQEAYAGLKNKEGFEVADIAGHWGYNACVWVYLGAHVTAFDHKAHQNPDHKRLDIFSSQIAFSPSKLPDIETQINAYDIIFINGGIESIPNDYLNALNPDGALYCIYRPEPKSAYAARITSAPHTDKMIVERLFDAYTPLLEEFQSPQGFIF